MSMQMELLLEGRGEAPRAEQSDDVRAAAQGDERSGVGGLMEQVVERENCLRALKRVRSNKGSAGIDGMRVEELRVYLHGWKAYFRLADTPGVFQDLDKWIARRLRMVQLKQWKRETTVYRELRRRGVPERVSRAAAAHARSWWRTASHGALNTAMPRKYLQGLGLPKLAPH